MWPILKIFLNFSIHRICSIIENVCLAWLVHPTPLFTILINRVYSLENHQSMHILSVYEYMYI